MRIGILILIDELKPAGAENIAVNLALSLQQTTRYTPIVCATRCGGITEEKLKQHKIKYLVLERNRFFEIYKFAFLKSLIQTENIKIIHAHKSGSAIWGSILGKLCHVEAIVVHIHGTVTTWKHAIAERLGGTACDKIIAVSESERKRLIKRGFSGDKVITIHNGIDLVNFRTASDVAAKESLALNRDAPVVGILAELRPEKNHEMFLLAAREVISRIGDAYFLIVGDGEKRRELEDLAAELGISNSCRFTGHVKNIAKMLSIIDIGVLCSLTEALPLTLLEYMATSKPIIATKVGGVPEVVLDGVNGFVVDSGDYLALADRICFLLEHRELLKQMGIEGSVLVAAKFSEDLMLRKVVDLYEQILAHKGRKPRAEAVSSTEATLQ